MKSRDRIAAFLCHPERSSRSERSRRTNDEGRKTKDGRQTVYVYAAFFDCALRASLNMTG
jgi:hypothetical protein